MPEASQYKEGIIQALTEGIAQEIKLSELIDSICSSFPVSRRTVERYYQGVKGGKYKDGGGSQTVVTGEAKFAAITSKQPAPIVFTIADHRIELEPGVLYEAVLLYLDLKLRCGLTDNFTSVLRDGVGLIWQLLASKPKIDRGEVTMEVSHGGSSGDGEREP